MPCLRSGTGHSTRTPRSCGSSFPSTSSTPSAAPFRYPPWRSPPARWRTPLGRPSRASPWIKTLEGTVIAKGGSTEVLPAKVEAACNETGGDFHVNDSATSRAHYLGPHELLDKRALLEELTGAQKESIKQATAMNTIDERVMDDAAGPTSAPPSQSRRPASQFQFDYERHFEPVLIIIAVEEARPFATASPMGGDQTQPAACTATSDAAPKRSAAEGAPPARPQVPLRLRDGHRPPRLRSRSPSARVRLLCDHL